jgi:hypothetical protein
MNAVVLDAFVGYAQGGIHLQGVLVTCTFVECSDKQDGKLST